MKPRFQTIDTDQFIDGQIPVYDEDNRQFRAASRNSDGGASELNDLSDVLISDPQDGEVLSYDNGEWKNTVISGGGAVDSVNGQTGVVLLDYDDVGAASAASLSNHISDQNNPHEVTKSQVGLGNVTNDAQITLSQLDTDTTLAANSDARVPSQKAVKAYVDANSGGGGGGSVNSVTASLPIESSGGTNPNISLKKPTGDAGSNEAVFGDDSRLSDSRAPKGGAGGVLSGSYPNPGFAVDMATQGELDNAIAERGIPAGGSAGQVLAKQSGTNYAVGWVDQSGGNGGEAVPYFPPKQAAYGRKAMLGTWTKATGFTGDAFTRMMWIPEWACFIGISEKIWRSYDGKTFTQIATASGLNPQAAVWVPEIRRIISTGNSSNALYWCDINDPTSWSTVPAGGVLPSENFNSLYYSSQTRLLVGRAGGWIYYSEDYGDTWTKGGGDAWWGSDNTAYTNGGRTIYVLNPSSENVQVTHDFGATWESASPPVIAAMTMAADDSTGIFAYTSYPSYNVSVRKGLNEQLYTSSPSTQGVIRYLPELNLWTMMANGQTPKFSVDLKTWETAGDIEQNTFPSAWSEPLGIVVTSGRADLVQHSEYVKGES